MKLLITFLILLLPACTTEAQSGTRFYSDRFQSKTLSIQKQKKYLLATYKHKNKSDNKQLKSDRSKLANTQSKLEVIALRNCPGTTGKCLKAVRVAVQKAKGLPLVGECLSAKNFGPVLVEKYQAQRLPISNPSKAPIGSIIVYAPRKGRGHGHIEIKTERGFVSDHLSSRAYAGNVIGIFTL